VPIFIGRGAPLRNTLLPPKSADCSTDPVSDFDHRTSHVLLRLDPRSVDLGKPGVQHRFYGWPLAWTRSYGQGRVFYTALGHEASV
jgi:type 1 glutamine amidotransferase